MQISQGLSTWNVLIPQSLCEKWTSQTNNFLTWMRTIIFPFWPYLKAKFCYFRFDDGCWSHDGGRLAKTNHTDMRRGTGRMHRASSRAQAQKSRQTATKAKQENRRTLRTKHRQPQLHSSATGSRRQSEREEIVAGYVSASKTDDPQRETPKKDSNRK